MQTPDPWTQRYGVHGRLRLHDGISIATECPVNALEVEVDEVVAVAWRQDAPIAAALKMQRRHSRCHSDWLDEPRVWRHLEPHQEPPDRMLRAMGAPMLPGMD